MKLRNLCWRLLGGALLLGSQGARAEIVVVDGEPVALRQNGVNVRRTARSSSVVKTNAPEPAAVVRTEDLLNFLNGDRLHGRLVAVDGAGGLLTWQYKAAPDALRYQVAALDKVDLLPRKTGGVQPQKSILQLVNGDRLRGDVISLGASQMVFQTWYAGTLHIARERLAELTPAAAPLDVLYEGPTADLAGWTSDGSGNSSGLAYRNGGLVLPLGRPIGRKIPNLPEKVRFEFEVTGYANSYFVFWFFSDSPRNMGNNDAYYLNFYGNRIEFQRMVRNEGNRSLGTVEGEDRRSPKNRLLVTLLADRKERRFALLLDGKLAREFTDPQEFKTAGDCIMFQTHQASAMRISKIKIARWDGKLPKPESRDGATEQDTLVFVNSDSMSGKVRSIEKDNVKFETSYATLDVPLERIIRMRLANKLTGAAPGATNAPAATNAVAATVEPAAPAVRPAPAAFAMAGGVGQVIINAQVMGGGQFMFSSSGRPKSSVKESAPAAPAIVYPPGSTRCFFNDQDAVTLKLDKLADETVTGAAEGIGALKLPLGALSRLEFNPNAKRAAGDEDEDL